MNPLNLAEIRAELPGDSEEFEAEALRRYSDAPDERGKVEALRRLGKRTVEGYVGTGQLPREALRLRPKDDAELTLDERAALAEMQRIYLAKRERWAEKRERRMRRLIERRAREAALTQQQWKPFDYAPEAGVKESSVWPPCIDLNVLSQRAPLAPEFLIDPAWMPPGYATLLAGHGGVGKSGIALHLAVCIAMGHHFFGLAVKQRRVILLACEDRKSILHWRLARICAYEGIALADLAGHLEIIDLVGHDSILYARDPRTGESRTPAYWALDERMKALGAELLIVDGITDAFGGNENSKVEVKQFVNSLLALIDPERGAVLLIGHVAKPTASAPNTGEGYSGTTGWHNAARARWYLYPETEPGDDWNAGRLTRTGRLRLELQKSNYGAADQEMTFAWDDRARLFVGESILRSVSPAGRVAQEAEEKRGILEAGRAATAKGITVPAAMTGPSTAFGKLSAEALFPATLKGGGAKRRFQRLLNEMLSAQTIRVESYVSSSRHPQRKLVFQ